MRQSITTLVIVITISSFETLFSQNIPYISASRLVNWSNAGLLPETPDRADNVININEYNTGSDYDKIVNAISDANNLPGTTIIYLPAGTGVRDYIHVNDLASAHVKALEYLQENDSFTVNLATGEGYSVMEVIKEAVTVTGKTIDHTFVGRRPGDPAELIATSKQANELLEWIPQYSDLNTILKSMWNVYNPEVKHD